MDQNAFLILYEKRFKKNSHRHPFIKYDEVQTYLKSNSKLLETVMMMEETGGEPDIMSYQNQLFFVDFSKETPSGRRNLCYDEKARLSRKKFPPSVSAEMIAKKIGIILLDETMYRYIQSLEPLDLKTSSWIKTPAEIRQLGGALFGDCRYEKTFIYHNGADSYYGVRGFRGFIEVK